MKFDTNLEKKWFETAKSLEKTIVLPEAQNCERVALAGIECATNRIAKIVFLTDDDSAFEKYNIKQNEYLQIINYKTHELTPVLSSALYMKRKEKGMTEEQANEIITTNPIYYGTMMVELGLVDGMVGGAITSSGNLLKPALQIIKGKTKGEIISSFFVMVREVAGEEQVYVLSDCGLNIAPNALDIKQIAIQTANTMKTLVGNTPKVALLSYSTKGSADGDSAIKMRDAYKLLEEENVDFIFDGELQLDTAVVPEVANLKNPNGRIKGDANVFIFPDLQSGNIGYKIMQRFGGFRAFGPITQGMRKPINDLSRGCSVEEIVVTVAITAIQSEN